MNLQARTELRQTDHGRLLLSCLEVMEGKQPTSDEWSNSRHHLLPGTQDIYKEDFSKPLLAKAIQCHTANWVNAADWWSLWIADENAGKLKWWGPELFSGLYASWIILAKVVAYRGLVDHDIWNADNALKWLSHSIRRDIALITLVSRKRVVCKAEDGTVIWDGVGTRCAGGRTNQSVYQDRGVNRVLAKALAMPPRIHNTHYWEEEMLKRMVPNDFLKDPMDRAALQRLLAGTWDTAALERVKTMVGNTQVLSPYVIERTKTGHTQTFFTEPPPPSKTVALWGAITEQDYDEEDLCAPYPRVNGKIETVLGDQSVKLDENRNLIVWNGEHTDDLPLYRSRLSLRVGLSKDESPQWRQFDDDLNATQRVPIERDTIEARVARIERWAERVNAKVF